MRTFEQLFTIADFKRIPSIPVTFDLSILEPYWLQVLDGLDVLLPDDHAVWNVPADTDSTDLRNQRLSMKKYAVYAIAASWYLQGDVMVTESGAVTKERENSESIEDTRKTELYRRYTALANEALADLAGRLRGPVCGGSGAVVGPRVTVLTGAKRSKY